MTETTVDLKNLMPTERKSTWRTAEERRMSDLTRVLEWLERRRGKKRLLLQQKVKDEVAPGASEKADKKGAGSKKKDGKSQRETASRKVIPSPHRLAPSPPSRALKARTETFFFPSELDIKDAIALESTQRPNPFRRQSSTVDPMAQDSMFNTRKVTLLREWSSKMPDSSYERKLKSLMEKGTEPKIETAKMLKPEEVLSCRYLRLSKNNIRTLVKLCKDAGLDVDIHPHMVEAEIDSKKVFDRPGRGT
uniref:RIKEN cDNA 4933402J07 gene n=1 Tax=Jaculus jaculus TaxID=51337 RepID=A0A8C5KHK0_JACJA